MGFRVDFMGVKYMVKVVFFDVDVDGGPMGSNGIYCILGYHVIYSRVNVYIIWKNHKCYRKLTILVTMFNSFVSLPEGS